MHPRKLWQIFLVFIKVSTFTVGGGYAMLPVFADELAQKRRWLQSEDLLTTLAVAQSCPGLIAANVAVFIGIRLRGIWGALTAVCGVVLTPFLAIVALADLVMTYADNPLVAAMLDGTRSGVTALIILALKKLMKPILREFSGWILAMGAFALMVICPDINPVYCIAAGALIGIGLRYMPSRPAEKAVTEPDNCK